MKVVANSTDERYRRIVESLSALEPLEIELRDDSARHAVHAGAAGGAGHFAVRLVCAQFFGLNRIQRHRLVYAALRDLIPAQIHALNIEAIAPEETAPSN